MSLLPCRVKFEGLTVFWSTHFSLIWSLGMESVWNLCIFVGISKVLHLDFGSDKDRKDGHSSSFSSPSINSAGSHTACPSPLSSTPTPLPTRRLAKSFSVTPSTVTKGRLSSCFFLKYSAFFVCAFCLYAFACLFLLLLDCCFCLLVLLCHMPVSNKYKS